jgi:hypothetical protein
MGRNFLGLYEITGGKLKAALDPAARPESFEAYGFHIWLKQ